MRHTHAGLPAKRAARPLNPTYTPMPLTDASHYAQTKPRLSLSLSLSLLSLPPPSLPLFCCRARARSVPPTHSHSLEVEGVDDFITNKKIHKFHFTHLVVEGVQNWAHTHVTQRLVHFHFVEGIAGATHHLDSHLTKRKFKKKLARMLARTSTRQYIRVFAYKRACEHVCVRKAHLYPVASPAGLVDVAK